MPNSKSFYQKTSSYLLRKGTFLKNKLYEVFICPSDETLRKMGYLKERDARDAKVLSFMTGALSELDPNSKSDMDVMNAYLDLDKETILNLENRWNVFLAIKQRDLEKLQELKKTNIQ
jgi:hypothetical protein